MTHPRTAQPDLTSMPDTDRLESEVRFFVIVGAALLSWIGFVVLMGLA